MTDRDPLQCSFDDARRINLLDGIRLSTRAKVAFFEEMVTFVSHFGAHDRLAGRRAMSRIKDANSALVAAQPPQRD